MIRFNFCIMLLLTHNTSFSMLHDTIKTIQTKQVNGWLAFKYPAEIEYKECSKRDVCRYIKDLSKSHEALRNFLEENREYKILLVGLGSKRHIDFSLLEFEKKTFPIK